MLGLAQQTPHPTAEIRVEFLLGASQIFEMIAIALLTNLAFPHVLAIFRKYWPERFGDDV